MESLLEYIDMIEDLIDNSKAVPFSTKVSVDKDQLFEIVSEMRLNLPHEIRQAQKIIEDHDRIIVDAKNKSSNMMKEAEIRAREMTDDHEIYKRATDQAREIVEDAKRSARDMRLSAVDYADDILSKTENSIRDSMESMNLQYRVIEDSFTEIVDVIYNNRQELRGSNT